MAKQVQKKAVRKIVKSKAKLKSSKPAARPVAKQASAKLDRILKQQEQILKSEEAIRADESRIEHLEEKEIVLEKQSLAEERKEEAQQRAENAELAKLETLEKDIKAQVAPHPLTRLTVKDFMKGIVGAFIGVVVHFTFTYGVELAEHITAARATALLIFSLVIGTIFLYFTGFRKVDKSIKWLLPYRILVLYGTAIIITVATLWFFYPGWAAEPGLAYKQVATVNLSAVIGACTADLIGRD